MLLLYRGRDFDANFFYHAVADIDHSFLLINDQINKTKTKKNNKSKKVLFVPKMNRAEADSLFNDGKVMTYTDPTKDIPAYLRKRKIKKLKADFLSLSAALAAKFSKTVRLSDASDELREMRRIKRPDEILLINKAVKYTRSIFDDLDPWEAKTELELKGILLSKIFDLGLTPSYDPIVATDSNSGFPHHQPNTKKLGNLIMIDMGVRYKNYCSDLTRCFIKGKRDTKTSKLNLQY